MSIGMTPFEHYMAMMLLPLLTWHLGIAGLPKPRIGSRRAKTYSRLSRTIYRWPRINRRYMQIGTGSSALLRWETWYFLRLQPYRQSSLKKSGAEKLKPHFYGPYRVIQRVGEVAYELELSEKGSKIHNVFHVHASKRHWDNRSLLRQSYLHWMRRGN
jgi:hypothetical protein